MGTVDSTGQLGASLFGKSKRALLALFYVQPERTFYLRQIVRTLEIGQGAVQRELARLVGAGAVGTDTCEQAGLISKKEADEMVAMAHLLRRTVEEWLRANHPELFRK